MQGSISRLQYEAIRANEAAVCRELASKWGVEVVGRDYPYLSRAGPAFAGDWYVICNGVRRKPTAAQMQDLERVGHHGVHAIGPIYANVSSTGPSSSGAAYGS